MVKFEICWVTNWIVKGGADTKEGSTTVAQPVQVCFAADNMLEASHILDELYLLYGFGATFISIVLNKAVNYTF